MQRFVIGADGGGTKTLGAIADESGQILAQSEVGSTNHHSNPMETVRSNLEALTGNLLRLAGAEASQLACVCLGMAGVDRPEDKKMVTDLVGEILPGTPCVPVNDAVIALLGGTKSMHGIIVISGTGSIAFGMNKAGERERAGGWGHILGDEGSGYSIGLHGLRAVCRAHDGRRPATALRDVILKHFGFDRPEQILGWIKQTQGSKAEIAALSRLVFEASEMGDVTAANILRGEAAELADAAAAVAKRVLASEKDYQIVVGGGNLRKNQPFFEMFQSAVGGRVPGIGVIQPQGEPVEGAVLYALKTLSGPAT